MYYFQNEVVDKVYSFALTLSFPLQPSFKKLYRKLCPLSSKLILIPGAKINSADVTSPCLFSTDFSFSWPLLEAQRYKWCLEHGWHISRARHNLLLISHHFSPFLFDFNFLFTHCGLLAFDLSQHMQRSLIWCSLTVASQSCV